MMSEGTTIEKSHFVCREDNIYPLYNVSLLIDLYDIWENKLISKNRFQLRMRESLTEFIVCLKWIGQEVVQYLHLL